MARCVPPNKGFKMASSGSTSLDPLDSKEGDGNIAMRPALDHTDRPSHPSLRQMDRELTPEEYQKMIDKLKRWATPRKNRSKSATGLANARLIEKIAEDGRVTKEDEHIIINCINCQRGWWQVLILMDTLIMAILLPMLVYEEPPDNGHFSEANRTKINLAYYTCLSFAFYASILQLFVTLLVYALTSYLIEMKSILYLFMHCHDLFVWMNTGGLAIVPCLILASMMGHIMMVGPVASIPSSVFGTLSIVVICLVYFKVIKPIFFNIFKAEYGAWGKKKKGTDFFNVFNEEIGSWGKQFFGAAEVVEESSLFADLSASFKRDSTATARESYHKPPPTRTSKLPKIDESNYPSDSMTSETLYTNDESGSDHFGALGDGGLGAGAARRFSLLPGIDSTGFCQGGDDDRAPLDRPTRLSGSPRQAHRDGATRSRSKRRLSIWSSLASETVPLDSGSSSGKRVRHEPVLVETFIDELSV